MKLKHVSTGVVMKTESGTVVMETGSSAVWDPAVAVSVKK
jgi:hypothetical protein